IVVANIGGNTEALRQLAVASDLAPDGSPLGVAARGQVKVLSDHVRFLQQSFAQQNLINVRFHGEHMFNLVHGEPIVDLDGIGGPSNPGDGVGLVGQANRDGYLPAITRAAVDIAGADGADVISQNAAVAIGKASRSADALLSAIAANGSR